MAAASNSTRIQVRKALVALAASRNDSKNGGLHFRLVLLFLVILLLFWPSRSPRSGNTKTSVMS